MANRLAVNYYDQLAVNPKDSDLVLLGGPINPKAPAGTTGQVWQRSLPSTAHPR